RSIGYNSSQWEAFVDAGLSALVLTDEDEWGTWNSKGDPVLHVEVRDVFMRDVCGVMVSSRLLLLVEEVGGYAAGVSSKCGFTRQNGQWNMRQPFCKQPLTPLLTLSPSFTLWLWLWLVVVDSEGMGQQQ